MSRKFTAQLDELVDNYHAQAGIAFAIAVASAGCASVGGMGGPLVMVIFGAICGALGSVAVVLLKYAVSVWLSNAANKSACARAAFDHATDTFIGWPFKPVSDNGRRCWTGG